MRAAAAEADAAARADQWRDGLFVSWAALMANDFYREINMLHDTISDECCQQGECASIDFFLDWADRCVAHATEVLVGQRMSFGMFVDSQRTVGAAAAPGCELATTTHALLQGILRTWSHLYREHYGMFVALGAAPHLNTCCRRFLLFLECNHVLDPREFAMFQTIIVAAVAAAGRGMIAESTAMGDGGGGGGGGGGGAGGGASAGAPQTQAEQQAMLAAAAARMLAERGEG